MKNRIKSNHVKTLNASKYLLHTLLVVSKAAEALLVVLKVFLLAPLADIHNTKHVPLLQYSVHFRTSPG